MPLRPDPSFHPTQVGAVAEGWFGQSPRLGDALGGSAPSFEFRAKVRVVFEGVANILFESSVETSGRARIVARCAKGRQSSRPACQIPFEATFEVAHTAGCEQHNE